MLFMESTVLEHWMLMVWYLMHKPKVICLKIYFQMANILNPMTYYQRKYSHMQSVFSIRQKHVTGKLSISRADWICAGTLKMQQAISGWDKML